LRRRQPALQHHSNGQAQLETKVGQKSPFVFGALRALTSSNAVRRLAYQWRRLLRLRATPHEVALGCAAGIFAAFTPFLGFQMLIAGALAFVLRVNIPAALLGTFAGNPLSWPAIWAASYLTGAWLFGLEPALSAGQFSESASAIAAVAADPSSGALDAAAVSLAPHVKPLIAGSLLVGLIASALSYYPMRRAVRRFQRRSGLVSGR
jgi:uncharacterized protein (DUF2062 family)